MSDSPWCLGSIQLLDRTGSGVESSQAYLQNPRAIVARFKQRYVEGFTDLRPRSSTYRNADLRRILEYPDTPAGDHISEPNPQPNSPF